MKVDSEIIQTILVTLRDCFPHALLSEGYSNLLSKHDEDILDGHLIYLSQKGLITLPAKYNYFDDYGNQIPNPVRGQGRWAFEVKDTFITCHGIDYLADQGV